MIMGNLVDPAPYVDWYFLAAGVAAILVALYKLFRRFERIEELRVTLDKQFGGNSGGIRQAVNQIDGKIDGLHARVTDLARDFEHLHGRFDQHIGTQTFGLDANLERSTARDD